MSYKTILVHVDHSGHAQTRYRLAAGLAFDHGAHLVGAAMTGVSRFLAPGAIENAANVVAEQVELMQSQARAALDTFEASIHRLGVPSFECRLVDDDLDGGLAVQARYADLAIVSQFDPDTAVIGQWSDLPEYVFLHSARPVLVLPRHSPATALGRHALVAWDTSPEATHAVSYALPLLKEARQVSVLVLNAVSSGDHGGEPGADLALYLARHGVKVEVVQRETSRDAGAALLAQVDRLGADMLVMGGYGHTRFREMLVGGATRAVLAGTPVPVLFAH